MGVRLPGPICKHGDIGERKVVPDEHGRALGAVREHHLERVGADDHVGVGHDVALLVQDHAAADVLSLQPACCRLGAFDSNDAGTAPGGCGLRWRW